MSDLRVLHDAFAELERRADAVTAERAFESTSPAKSRTAPRLALVAAAVVVVAGAAAGTALLVPDDRPGTQVAASSTTDVPTADLPTTASTPPAPPGTPEELAARLRAVLGGTATFTVTEAGPGAVVMTAPAAPTAGAWSTPPPAPTSTSASTSAAGTQVGASIVGTLTADGITGGFHLIVYPGMRGEARCDGIPGSDCTTSTLPDGSSLTTQRTALQGSPTGVTQMVNLVRPDGVALILHVSNVTDPKGLGAQLADVPPLTVERMAGIVTSDLW
ncbi:hypothetical protein [Saccharothrix yanglingensis]|uniref:Uncharacterized protein n=1 Tax=Saccharothrix yanglingensis TaxID=659496 RepID=A0ABU0WVU1_9PSEU|nr:hypothetical protein [Saccharothrix yanglingensis]MDQ2583981.1 hypothetical protein [Saccharothrix yanglingensis]